MTKPQKILTVSKPGPLVGLGSLDITPNAGGEWRYKLRSLACNITTDANVADRPFALRIQGPDGAELAVLVDASVQAASLTANHYWIAGTTSFAAVANLYTLHVFPSFILEPGWKCQYVGLNAQAGDTVIGFIAVWEILQD